MTFVVPGDVDQPTGGNVWDQRVRDALAGLGHPVVWRPVAGGWPEPSAAEAAALGRALAAAPDGSTVLLDGLVGCGVPDVVLPHRGRVRLAVVVHLPLADESGLPAGTARRLAAAEAAVLAAADVVVVTSAWAASRVAGARASGAAPVVAPPGTDPAPGGGPEGDRGGEGGGHLLCLAALTPRKGQRVLAAALRDLDPEPGWELRLVGPERDAGEAAALRDDLRHPRLAGRVRLLGPATGAALERHWRWADLLVVPSLLETFGMVVGEALPRGLPAVVTTGSALPATLGTTPHGPPGLLVPPGDPAALAAALRRWLTDPALRADLASRARLRSGELPGWEQTAAAVAAALDLPDPASAHPHPPP